MQELEKEEAAKEHPAVVTSGSDSLLHSLVRPILFQHMFHIYIYTHLFVLSQSATPANEEIVQKEGDETPLVPRNLDIALAETQEVPTLSFFLRSYPIGYFQLHAFLNSEDSIAII